MTSALESNEVKPALSVAINQMLYEMRAQDKDVVALSLGEAFFNIPLLSFEALDWERGFHYSDSKGIPELRGAIADLYSTKYDCFVDGQSEILVTAGSKIAIFMVLKSLLDLGDVVSVFEPAWVSYREQILIAGGIPRFVSFEESFEGTLRFDPKTKVVIVNNPNNPSGRNYSSSELRRIKSACDLVGATLVVDEAYSDFVRQGEFYSARRLGDDVIVVNSLSKNLGMSGWRIGYVIANAGLIADLLRLQQNLVTCAPTLLQLYVAKYLDELLNITKSQIQATVQRREATSRFLAAHGIPTLPGDSTFYLFARADGFGCTGNVTDFAVHAMLNYGVSVVPGIAYGSNTSQFIRIAVGVEPLERIKEGILQLIAASSSVPSRADLLQSQRNLGLQSSDWSQW